MVKSEKFYHIGYATIPEIDDERPPEIAILIPRWYDPHTSPFRLLVFRYERYVAVFDMGSINSRPMMVCIMDVVLPREDYAKTTFKAKIRSLSKQHYFNHYSILEMAAGRQVSQTMHDMLQGINTDKVIRGIKMPCNSKSTTSDNLYFINAKMGLMSEIIDKMSTLKEGFPK